MSCILRIHARLSNIESKREIVSSIAARAFACPQTVERLSSSYIYLFSSVCYYPTRAIFIECRT